MLKPLGSMVLIKPIEEEKRGNLYVPGTSSDTFKKGLVMDVGEGFPDEPIRVAVDELVLYNSQQAIQSEEGGTPVVLVDDADIVAKFT